jgi:23S rRNA pseudouridine1911/1915/1917 synthase
VSESIIVSDEEEGFRLDKLLSVRFPAHSRTYFQYLIENGSVLVNGQKCKKREVLKIDDEVEICFILTPEIALEPENIPLEILYEDEEILAVNKPVGMVVHPAVGHPNGTFVNALLYHCRELQTAGFNDLRPGIVHRLDKDTSGVLVAAKTLAMHALLVDLFLNRSIEKHYLAVCVGNPGNKTIDAPIGRHPLRRKEMAVVEERGRTALSHCKTLKIKDQLSLVDIHLVTGRTHQIRVHMKHINTPILGDSVYGSTSANQKHGVARQLLHAHTIQFQHPRTGQPIALEAPLTSDFLKWMNIFDM